MENLEFTLSIPEEKAEIVFEAFAKTYNYQPEEGGETIDSFCKRKVVEFITDTTRSYLLDKARKEAEVVANQAIDLSGIE